MFKILVVDDEEGIRSFIAEALEMEGYHVATASDGLEAAHLLQSQNFALVVTDLRMPKMTGLELLQKMHAEKPDTVFIVLTAHGTVDTAVEAMKLGAFDFLQKPLGSPGELRKLVARALEHRKLLHVASPSGDRSAPALESPLTYGSSVMKSVVDSLEKVARTNATVLLMGESGTGKEVAARKIHNWSSRSKGPFVAVNCAALSEHLLESELFGHERGAFTGASERRRGRVELAHGGTFFLDEIGEMKLDLQAKLLRVLQEKEFERVGGTQTIPCDVRWIAATNRDLPSLVADGLFREDLYHRLAVFPVRLPPLRERKEDIIPLAKTLLLRIASDLGQKQIFLSPEAETVLLSSDWPGNVRALANALERAAILADGARIESHHLSPPPPTHSMISSVLSSAESLANVERDAILRALAKVDGNRRKAAELLGIALRTLYDKLKKYDIQ